MKVQLPPDEEERLNALRRFKILDTDPEQEFDDVTLLASHICETPIAMISLIDGDRQWFKSRIGMTAHETPRDVAFCAHGILQPDFFEVEDALADERFATNPLVTGDPKIRFYAGAPLVTPEGHALGMLCVIDQIPRELTPAEKAALKALSRQVVAQLELRRNLSELKETGEALRESEERFRNYFELGLIGMAITSPAKGLIEVNDEMCRILGYERSELLRMSWTEFTHPDDLAADVANFNRVVAGEIDGYSMDKRFIRKDGRVIDATISGKCLRRADGSVDYFVALLQDVTERKQAEEALHGAHERLGTIIQKAPLAIIAIDSTAIIQMWNPAAERLFGWTEVELVGRPIVPLIPQEDRQQFEKLIAGEIQGEVRDGLELRRLRKDGSLVDVSVWTAPLRNTRNEIVGTIGMFADITERKRAEEAQRESQLRYETLVQSIDGIVWEADPQTFMFTFVSKQAERILGYPLEQWFEGPSFWPDHMHPADRDWAVKFCVDATARGEDHQFEYRMISADGRVVWLNDIVTLHIALDQSVILRGLMVDITERKLAEEGLQKEKEILAKIFDNIPVLVGFVGADGVTLVNPEWERTMGWTLQELQEQNVDIFAEAYPDLSYRQEVLDFVAAATGEWADLKIKVRDGRVIDAACAVVHLSDGTKVAIAQDITERKLAEEALRDSETRFRQIAENIDEVFWITDLKGSSTIYISPAYERIWGRSCESLYAEPKSWRDDIHPEDRPRMEATFASDPGSIGDYTYRIVRPDGSIRWIRDRGFPIRDESGEVVRFAGIAEDITASKLAEEELQQVNEQLRILSRRLFQVQEEERRHLARELHDEIGQALTAAKINLDSVESIEGSAQSLRLQETITLLDNLLGQVRQISLDLRPSMLDDLGLVPALRSLLDQQGRRASVAVRFSAESIPENLDPEIQTTCFRIAQEAITNAVRHAGAAQIGVDLRGENGRLRLLVRDNGIGFDAGSAQQQTVGLGLVGIKERAALAGGRAKVISSPNQGTTIEVFLPLTLPGNPTSRGLRQ